MKSKPWILAVAVVYVPLLLPFLVGPLTECDHCVASYARSSPLLPAFWADHALMEFFGRDSVPAFGSALGTIYRVALSLGAIALVRWLLGRRPALAWVGSAGVALWIGVHAIGFSVLLRM